MRSGRIGFESASLLEAPGFGNSLALAGDWAYTTRRAPPDMQRSFANPHRGHGALASVDVDIARAFGDIIADPGTGDLICRFASMS